MNANKIFVMQSGKVLESGRFKELERFKGTEAESENLKVEFPVAEGVAAIE